MFFENPLPKIEPLRGSVHLEWRKCGRSNCRCLSGHLHGPYFVRRWREGGRQQKAYVSGKGLAKTLLAIEARRASLPPASQIERLVRRQIR
jgi:hypothetical protein